MIIFGMVIIIIFISCFLLGIRATKNSNSYIGRNQALPKVILLAYIIFAGCFIFPISSRHFQLDFMKVYLIVASYGTIGLGFAGIYGIVKEKFIYLMTLILTVLGIVSRYVLEYGEVSNNYNFTLLNVICYIVLIPTFTVVAYHHIVKYLSKKK